MEKDDFLIYYSVFFIQLDCLGKLWEWDIGFYREVYKLPGLSDVLGFALFGESFLFSNLCDLVHSDGYGFTVAFSFIVEVLLNGVWARVCPKFRRESSLRYQTRLLPQHGV